MRGPAEHSVKARRRMRLGTLPEVNRARARKMNEKRGVDRTPPGVTDKRTSPRGPDNMTVLAHQKAAVKGRSPAVDKLAQQRASAGTIARHGKPGIRHGGVRRITEDMPGWNWRTMGNHRRGRKATRWGGARP